MIWRQKISHEKEVGNETQSIESSGEKKMIDVIIAAKNEIIGGFIVALLAWGWHKFRVLLKKYKAMKQELDRMREEITRLGATKEEHERLTAEIQRKDATLRQAEAKSQEDSRLITELRSQVEALQQEKAKKKIIPMSDSDFLKLCKSGDTEKIEKAIKNGANVNAQNYYGRTVLMWAAEYGLIKTAQLLLKHGANVNATDDKGRTALLVAIVSGNTETANLLRSYGA